MPTKFRPLRIDLASRRGENRLDVAREDFLRGAVAGRGVDEDFDAFLALGLAVGAIEEARDPGLGDGLRGFFDEVLDGGGADDGFGGWGCVVDYEGEGEELGPENVEERDCFGGFGFWWMVREFCVGLWY